jgi:hypothetical protein
LSLRSIGGIDVLGSGASNPSVVKRICSQGKTFSPLNSIDSGDVGVQSVVSVGYSVCVKDIDIINGTVSITVLGQRGSTVVEGVDSRANGVSIAEVESISSNIVNNVEKGHQSCLNTNRSIGVHSVGSKSSKQNRIGKRLHLDVKFLEMFSQIYYNLLFFWG